MPATPRSSRALARCALLARAAARLLFPLAIALGCGGGGAAVEPTTQADLALETVAVNPAAVSVEVGATTPLAVSTLGAGGRAVTGATLTFTSGDEQVATVDAQGVVRGVATGSTDVTVAAVREGVTRTTTVPVSVTSGGGGTPGANVVTTSGASFVPSTLTIAMGASVTWQIAGATHNVSFGANKPTGGDVPNIAPGGSATRTFSSAGTYDYQCTLHSGMSGTVIVEGNGPAVFTSVAVTPASPAITVGATATLSATPRDQNGSAMTGLPAATWTSSEAGVARVAAGVVTGVAAGTATITATITSGSVTRSATATVTVTAPSANAATVTTPGLTFSPQTVTIGTGGTVTWQFSGSTHNVTFGALRPDGGNIPDTDAGNAASRTFTVVGTYDYECTRHSGMTGRVVVQATGTPGQFTSLVLTPPTAFVTPGGTMPLATTALDGAGAPMSGLGAPTFRSTNTAAATVSASGLVTGVANGSALVIASLTAGGTTRADTTTVTVGTPAATISTTASTFTPEEVEIAAGGTVVWRFAGATHNVTFDDDLPPDGSIPDSAPGTSAARTFPTAGDYDFECTLHKGMKGRIRVR